MAEAPKQSGVTLNVTPKVDTSELHGALAKALAESLRRIADDIEGK